MLNLIIKDIAIQKRTILFNFIFVAVFAAALREIAFTASAVASVYILMQTACAYDDRNHADWLLNSLPLERDTVVMAKYLSMPVYIVIGIAQYLAVYLFIRLAGIPLGAQGFSLEGLIGVLFVACLFAGIFYPIFFRFGYMRTRYVNIILFAALFGGSAALMRLTGSTTETLAAMLNGLPGWAVVSGIVGMMLGIMLLSFLLSLRFYKRREF